MKNLSNLLFYPAAVTLLVLSLYLHFSGDLGLPNMLLFHILAVLLLVAYLINTIDRYGALLAFSTPASTQRFRLNAPLSAKAKEWPIMTFSISILFAFLFGVLLVRLKTEPWHEYIRLSGYLLLISAVEKSIYLLFTLVFKKFRAGINRQSLVVNNGTLQVILFEKLKSVECKYNEILFIHQEKGGIKSTVIDLVHPDEEPLFRKMLTEASTEYGFFLDPKLRA